MARHTLYMNELFKKWLFLTELTVGTYKVEQLINFS